ncbi:MAG: hydrogenase iron-sulfur subunit [Desulfoplanes sp.]
MAEKIGVYFDSASIGQYLDLEALAEGVRTAWGDLCPVVKVVPHLVGNEGKALIQADIDEGLIDAVCACGTSPRVDGDFFNFGPSVLVNRVNLREQCILSYQDPEGKALVPGGEILPVLMDVAVDYVNMGVVNLQKAQVPVAEAIGITKKVLVLGGGWTGINAALDVSAAGYEVLLVEKESQLGGYAKKMYKTIPMSYPFTTAEATTIDAKIAAVEADAKITVLTNASLQKLAGMPGGYTATIKTGKEEQDIAIGSVVTATGWVAQDKKYLEPFGYKSSKNIITSMEFEEMAKNGKIVCPADGNAPESVVFLLGFGDKLESFEKEEAAAKQARLDAEAAGDKAEENLEGRNFLKNDTCKHLPFSSEITSLTALKQANYVREFFPSAIAYVLYENMMVPGINELYYKAAQNDPGIMLAKGVVTSVTDAGDGSVIIQVKDTLLGDKIEIRADLVVLPTAMVPTTALSPVLQLQYRQGPAFPDLDLFDGYSDSNYICFPYETRRTGIYSAGCVRQPMTMATAQVDASGAALKAIQCLESSNRGMAVHPRSGDMSFPKFNLLRCTQCKRCTEECPFGALDEDEKGNPLINVTRCRRCGTCMGACPERVISFDDYNVDQIGSMIKQVKVPDKIEDGGPRFIVLACENDAYPALDMAAMRGRKWSPYIRVIPVRCLGSVNTIWIADAMSKGNDGCLLLGCKYGENYQCHFMKGSELCNRRMDNVSDTLKKLGIEPERVEQAQIAIDEYDRVPDLIDDFVERILKLGPNPFKGY